MLPPPGSPAPFAGFDADDLRFIATFGTPRRYRKNTPIIREGEIGDDFFILQSGGARVFASDTDGREVILNILKAGDYFGELALVDGEPRSASVSTTVESLLAVVSRDGFERCLAAKPALTLKFVPSLICHIRRLTKNVKNLALGDVYHRVIWTLLDLAKIQDGALMIESKLTHQDIADMTGTCRETVARIMKDMETGGYLEKREGRWCILRKFPREW